jgi:hypothetical protein
MWTQGRDELPPNVKRTISSSKTMVSVYFSHCGFVPGKLMLAASLFDYSGSIAPCLFGWCHLPLLYSVISIHHSLLDLAFVSRNHDLDFFR